MELPDLTLLGYSDRRPLLRIIRLSDRSVEPAGSALAKSIGFSRMFLRNGWIAVDCHQELWSIPLPMTAAGTLIARGMFDFAPSLDPANFWLAANTRNSGARVLVEIDGRGRSVSSPIPVEAGTRLHAVTPMGFVTGSEDAGLRLLESDGTTSRSVPGLEGDWQVIGAHGSTVVAEHRGHELAIVDLEHEQVLTVDRPGDGPWGNGAEFSPDGQTVAIEVRRDALSPSLPFTEAIAGPASHRRAWLVLIDVASGTPQVCEGEFESFAYVPVWSRDGQWIVFASPFEKRQIWLVERNEAMLRRVPFRRQPPMPMLDVTGVTLSPPSITNTD